MIYKNNVFSKYILMILNINQTLVMKSASKMLRKYDKFYKNYYIKFIKIEFNLSDNRDAYFDINELKLDILMSIRFVIQKKLKIF